MKSMIETLYKTANPEREKSECYVLVLTSRVASGRRVFAFMEEHGKWDDGFMRFLFQVNSVSAEEGLTYDEALEMYKASKQNLAEKGFVHSFVPDCARKESRREHEVHSALVLA
jgi:hypothetical protein